MGLSGYVLSAVGPLEEIYDASPNSGSCIVWFFGMPPGARSKMGQDRILKLVAEQLVKLFGSEAKNTKAILYKDWASDSETAVEEDFSPLKNYQSYGQPPVEGLWEKKIIFAGTESNSQSSGHLEGALLAAEKAVSKIINLYNNSLSQD